MPVFTFGKSVTAPPSAVSATNDTARANFDVPAASLKWWKAEGGGRDAATASGAAAADIQAFWAAAAADPAAVVALTNAKARAANRAAFQGSSVSASLRDAAPPRMADAIPAYREDFCAGHVAATGWRGGVRHSPAAVQAAADSRAAAARNKTVGRRRVLAGLSGWGGSCFGSKRRLTPAALPHTWATLTPHCSSNLRIQQFD